MRTFTKGDRVTVARRVDSEPGWANAWVRSMDKYIGNTLTVEGSGATGVFFKEGAGDYAFPPSSLELVTTEAVPDTKPSNPKDSIADKKLPLWLCSPLAKAKWAVAQYAGMLKYGAWNWRIAGVRSSVYLSAMQRHMDAYLSGEELDPVDQTEHLANIMACCAILMDAKEAGKLADDRPPSVGIRPAYEDLMKRMEFLKGQYKDMAPKHYTIADTEVGA